MSSWGTPSIELHEPHDMMAYSAAHVHAEPDTHVVNVGQISTIDPLQEDTSDAVLAEYHHPQGVSLQTVAALPNNAFAAGADNGNLYFFKLDGAVIRQSVILAALMCGLTLPVYTDYACAPITFGHGVGKTSQMLLGALKSFA